MANHILVVDDEKTTTDLLGMMLKMLNYPVETAALGTDAIALAQSDPPLLILLDLMLPDMAGAEVCAAIRAAPQTAQVPIVILTARHDTASHDEAIAAGASHVLTKPVTRAQLADCLEMMLKGRRDGGAWPV